MVDIALVSRYLATLAYCTDLKTSGSPRFRPLLPALLSAIAKNKGFVASHKTKMQDSIRVIAKKKQCHATNKAGLLPLWSYGNAAPRAPPSSAARVSALQRCPAPGGSDSQPAEEMRPLLQITSAWGEPLVLAAWNASPAGTHCRWPYARCDTDGHVSGLALARVNVSDPFPDAINGLSSFKQLDVSRNNIADTFPTSLYHCRCYSTLPVLQPFCSGAPRWHRPRSSYEFSWISIVVSLKEHQFGFWTVSLITPSHSLLDLATNFHAAKGGFFAFIPGPLQIPRSMYWSTWLIIDAGIFRVHIK